VSALAALRAGAASLLEARGEGALAAIVRAARVELAGPGESWTMGSREVSAHRVALGVPAEAFAALTGDASKLGAVREAFAQAMRSPATELCDLCVELLLPVVDRPWGQAYREAPVRAVPSSRPDPEAVLAGAAALLSAAGDEAGAAMLDRARLSTASAPALTRYVVLLPPADRARTWREPALEERVRRAVYDAALRAGEQVTVELGVEAGF
jgi:hypothetical protein